MKILVKAAMNPYSGYGNDGIGIVRALLRMGLDVYLDAGYYAPPLPDEVAALLTRRLEAPFDLLLHHVDPAQLGLAPQTRKASATTIAWTMWEYSTLDNLPNRRSLKKRLRDYDMVLGYDQVSTDALAPYVTTAGETLQGGFWPDQWPQVDRDWTGDRFGFCMVGQLHERKDPFLAVQAFKELKDEHPDEFAGAELHLKTNVPGLHSAMEEWVPKLRVHYAVWPEQTLRDFYAAQHCLLAPSRGEGKNMPALEFLSTGGTVIATNWGGHQQWLSSSIGYPLDYTLAPLGPKTPDCRNARASKEHLKAQMLHVYRNRDEARRKGSLAADLIPQMCSWDAVMERLLTKIADRTGRGHLASEARISAQKLRTAQGLVHA